MPAPSLSPVLSSLQNLKHFSCFSAVKPKWNTNSSLIITNPILLIMESCNSMYELKQIQAYMTRNGLIAHLFPVSRLLSFCALSDSGNINHAHLLFSQISKPNIYIYNTMIKGYSKSQLPRLSFLLFRFLVREGIEMDNRTFVFTLKACERFLRFSQGEEVHCQVYKLGFAFDVLVLNGLIHFYMKSGSLVLARYLFDTSSIKDVVTWTTMIDGYVQKNFPHEAMKLFYSMLSTNVEPNEVTMITILSACSLMGNLSLGRSIHAYIEKNNVKRTPNLVNASVDMYVKCGCLTTAREVFNKMEAKDVFSWTSMISGYAKDGNLNLARKFFDDMPERNVVSWNAMIAGYSQNNQPEEALKLFHQMKEKGVKPIEATLVCVLSACAQLGCLDFARWIYKYYVGLKKVQFSVTLTNAFIDMYAKCGNLDEAAKLFNSITKKDLVSWNSMIMAYATHGYAEKSLNLFEEMKRDGLWPDDITFVGVLSACCHGGLVNQGRSYFEIMREVFRLEPKAEHYVCMIDLLGRVGNLKEAYELIKIMPMKPDEAAWGALLNACRMHKNVELGKFAAGKLLDLNPKDSGVYVLLANMCAAGRRWEDVRMVRRMMRSQGIKKTPGCSSIEVEGESHEFVVADKSHPRYQEIYQLLDDIFFLLRLEGYIPETSQFMSLHEAGHAVMT
ncbi:pentatricopeptide repeat-containing protein At2g22410, mitochondrial-like isoform X1 [Papaver somniferum]|uniref:pentatricopeptide repeat-containing protein At2g22410, mitochondrial-like isoform X1 n=1 Tax=Papaver somniferum TaxID=3469 RepID=UPI000E6FB6E2|nr:pentatricopeptide repeat-containing protein At2g22410, mitochondrial-like isoform X1 [Papaver somniferum]